LFSLVFPSWKRMRFWLSMSSSNFTFFSVAGGQLSFATGRTSDCRAGASPAMEERAPSRPCFKDQEGGKADSEKLS